MKKKMFLVLIICLAAFGLAACADSTTGGQFVGTWVAATIEVNGKEESAKDLDFKVVLKENKTANIVIDGQSTAADWQLTGKGFNLINSGGYKMVFIGYADQVKTELNGKTIHFVKE